MAVQTLRRRMAPGLALVLACVGMFGLGRLVGGGAPALHPAAVCAAEQPEARVEAVSVSGLDGGRVTVADREVAVLAVASGDVSGYERAVIVADRINRQIRAGLRAADVLVQTSQGAYVISGREVSLVTVTIEDARVLQEGQQALAERWAGNLREALGGPREAATTTESTWQPSEPYEDRIVPILSLLEGTRLGVARVNGPESRVERTQAVAQFSIDFRKFLEIDIYVPISTKTPGKQLDRVQGVGVTGLGDLRL
ncbi:hypothetical protein LLH23_19060 [bacterium]|nr:hypothetical protein [bacterium]